jgi:hypothetical protein
VPGDHREALLVGWPLPVAGARIQDALAVHVDVRVVARHPGVEFRHLIGKKPGVAKAGILAQEAAEAREHVPRTAEEAAVGATASGPAHVGLEQDDSER